MIETIGRIIKPVKTKVESQYNEIVDALTKQIAEKIIKIRKGLKSNKTNAQKHELKDVDLDHVWHPYTQMATYPKNQTMIVKADRVRVEDTEGNQYIDGVGGLWCVNAGHGRESIINAMMCQGADISYVSLFGKSHEPAAQLAKMLADITPEGLNHVFYANGGTEAVETAIKIARLYFKNSGLDEKMKILNFEGGWHGCTLGSLAASGQPEEQELFLEEDPNYITLPYFKGENQTEMFAYFQKLEQQLYEIGVNKIAALVFEPIQGVGGMYPMSKEFYKKLSEILKRYNILMIADEVTTGFGRTGNMFGCDKFDIKPDMMVLGKGLTSGYAPLSATVINSDIYNKFKTPNNKFMHGYSYGGHPVSCAAAIENINIFQNEALPEKAEESGQHLKNQLKKRLLQLDRVADVRGVGMMNVIELQNPETQTRMSQTDTRKICTFAQNEGLIIRSLDHNIPLMPPLILTEEDIEEIVNILEKAIKKTVL